ncbi:hypothetical protein SAMN05216311_105120 [Chitinophaga sp. CF418]|nr:hypothetical protein SAMN05216311_105120 [Chitinophaga sp. CF418]
MPFAAFEKSYVMNSASRKQFILRDPLATLIHIIFRHDHNSLRKKIDILQEHGTAYMPLIIDVK